MIIPFVLVIGILGVSVMMALYSSFMPYFSLLRDIEQYNKAYYGANTAIERSLLSLRYHEAGFEGSSGWSGGREGESFGAPGDFFEGTGFFGSFDENSALWRDIESRIKGNTFPRSQDKQIPVEFVGSDSDRGALGYNQILKIPLRVDDSNITSAYSQFAPSDIKNYSIGASDLGPEFSFILNDVAKSALGVLDENSFNTTAGGFPNEIAINRDWSGKIGLQGSYSILPRIGVALSGDDPIITSYDENIRMRDINRMTNTPSLVVRFSNFMNPLYNGSVGGLRTNTLASHLLIGSHEATQDKTFHDIIATVNDTHQNEISFSLQNILKAVNSNGIHPFVQWNMKLDGTSLAPFISKPYFTIVGSSRVGSYNVSMKLKQPLDTAYLGSFTVVF